MLRKSGSPYHPGLSFPGSLTGPFGFQHSEQDKIENCLGIPSGLGKTGIGSMCGHFRAVNCLPIGAEKDYRGGGCRRQTHTEPLIKRQAGHSWCYGITPLLSFLLSLLSFFLIEPYHVIEAGLKLRSPCLSLPPQC